MLAFLKLVIVIVLPILTYDKLIVYGGFMLGVSLFNFASYYIYSKYKFEQVVFVPRFNAAMFKKMLSFAGWNLFESFAIAIQGPGVNVILNYYVGPSVNAARGVASQVYSAVRGFSENVSMAFKSQIVGGYAQGNIDRTRLLFFSLSKICYLLMFLLSTPILIELEYILDKRNYLAHQFFKQNDIVKHNRNEKFLENKIRELRNILARFQNFNSSLLYF